MNVVSAGAGWTGSEHLEPASACGGRVGAVVDRCLDMAAAIPDRLSARSLADIDQLVPAQTYAAVVETPPVSFRSTIRRRFDRVISVSVEKSIQTSAGLRSKVSLAPSASIEEFTLCDYDTATSATIGFVRDDADLIGSRR